MLGNNISNKQAPYILFDIDSLLFVEPKEIEKTVFTKVKDMFKTHEQKLVEREFDPLFISRIEEIWAKHNLCIGLVTFDIINEEQELIDRLSDKNVPYTRLFTFAEWEEMREFNAIYKVSKNAELLSYLSQNHAIHYDRLGEVLNR